MKIKVSKPSIVDTTSIGKKVEYKINQIIDKYLSDNRLSILKSTTFVIDNPNYVANISLLNNSVTITNKLKTYEVVLFIAMSVVDVNEKTKTVLIALDTFGEVVPAEIVETHNAITMEMITRLPVLIYNGDKYLSTNLT